MDINQLSKALAATLDPNQQKAAEAFLSQMEQSNFAEYLKALATILADPAQAPATTRSAGLILKNAFFDSRSEQAKNAKYAKWNQMVQDQYKLYIKNAVLSALLSPIPDARKSAAQVVAALGVLEISEKRWPEMIPALYTNATNPQLADDVKVHTLEAMGYLCESLNPAFVTEELTNNLLTAIVDNVKVGKPDVIRHAAITALFNTLEFADANMQRSNERDFIVMNICECARATSADVKCTAFDCMVQLAELYYKFLSPQYMEAFYNLTLGAVQAAGSSQDPDNERVALHAIEFWSALCEVEADLHERDDPDQPCKHFIRSALPSLVQLITTVCLTKQDDDLTDDPELNIAMAGGTLLGLISQCEPGHILPVVMPFVQANLPLMGQDKWRQREAGLMAFGKCLEGPDSTALAPVIREGMDFFLSLLDPAKESVPQVRDTAAFVIATVCEMHHTTIEDFLPKIVPALVQVLHGPVAVVAAKHALAIKFLAQSYRDDADLPTNRLSPHIQVLLPKLIEASQRKDWEEGDLRAECFEAVNAIVESSAQDGLPIIYSLLDEIVRQLVLALSVRVETSEQRDEVSGMVQYCCGTLLVIVQKLKLGVQSYADQIMNLMLQILIHMHNGIALMDAHLVVGAMAVALGDRFKNYYKAVLPHVVRALQNREEYQTCQTATELISDFARAVGLFMVDDCDGIMQILLANVADPNLNQTVKPTTISAFGDIAFAIGDRFEPYAERVLLVLEAAIQLQVDKDDYDQVEYLNEIREAVLETYTSLLHTFGQKSYNLFAKRLDLILHSLAAISREVALEDDQVSADVQKNSVGLLGDLCKYVGNDAKLKIRSGMAVFQPLLQSSSESEDDDMRDAAKYCMRMLQ